MEGTKSNRIEVLIKDKYLLIIKEAGAYFGLGIKMIRRLAGENEKGFAYDCEDNNIGEYMDGMGCKNILE